MGGIRRLLALFLACAPLLGWAQSGYEHPDTRLAFPPRLAGFEFASVHRHADPRLGVQVSYVLPGLGKADFTLYSYAQKRVPGGIESEQVHSAFRSADRDVYSLYESAQYLELKRVVPLEGILKPVGGKPEFYVAAYTYRPGRENADRVVSWLLVTGLRNHFFKIRYTHAADEAEKGRLALGRLLDAFFEANRN